MHKRETQPKEGIKGVNWALRVVHQIGKLFLVKLLDRRWIMSWTRLATTTLDVVIHYTSFFLSILVLAFLVFLFFSFLFNAHFKYYGSHLFFSSLLLIAFSPFLIRCGAIPAFHCRWPIDEMNARHCVRGLMLVLYRTAPLPI